MPYAGIGEDDAKADAQHPTDDRARREQSRTWTCAAATAHGTPAWRQPSGIAESRSPAETAAEATGTGTSPARQGQRDEDLAIRLSCRARPAYCGATPTECVPFFGSAVSSMTSTACVAADQGIRLGRPSSRSRGALSQRPGWQRNDAADRSRLPVSAATPSAARSCARRDRSNPQHRADTSVASALWPKCLINGASQRGSSSCECSAVTIASCPR